MKMWWESWCAVPAMSCPSAMARKWKCQVLPPLRLQSTSIPSRPNRRTSSWNLSRATWIFSTSETLEDNELHKFLEVLKSRKGTSDSWKQECVCSGVGSGGFEGINASIAHLKNTKVELTDFFVKQNAVAYMEQVVVKAPSFPTRNVRAPWNRWRSIVVGCVRWWLMVIFLWHVLQSPAGAMWCETLHWLFWFASPHWKVAT